MNTIRLMQVFSCDNDTNGNPSRLVLVYDIDGAVLEVYEARSSSPNITAKLRQRGYVQLPSFHLTPDEYNETKKVFRPLLQHVF